MEANVKKTQSKYKHRDTRLDCQRIGECKNNQPQKAIGKFLHFNLQM